MSNKHMNTTALFPEVIDVEFTEVLTDLEKVKSRDVIARMTGIKLCTIKNIALGLHDPKWSSGMRLYNYALKVMGADSMAKYKK